MKNTINKYFVIALLSVGIVACDPGDFGDVNINPNATTTPLASALLTSAINNVDDVVNATQGQLYVQYLANSQYTDADSYTTVQFDYNGWYSGPLYDLEQIIELNTNEETKEAAALYGSNVNQIAVAEILQSYFYLHLTDRWGDIPYTESLRVREDILQPAFDTQEAVYSAIFSTLDAAEAAIEDANPVVGDNLFYGDMERWRQFANSIRLTAALRLSEVDPAKGEAEFNAALADGVITTNDENIYYAHLADDVYDNPWQDRFETRMDYTVANTLVNRMQTSANVPEGELTLIMDPRLPVYANPTENSGEYIGMPYGLSEAEAGAISNSVVSFLGDALREQTAPTYLFTAAQMAFARAEAAMLGWTSEDAQTWYETGIELSIEQYVPDVSDATIATYLSDPYVAYDGSLEQLMTQKWIANYLNGYEAWSDWRRTGFPVLVPAAAAQNESGEIPVRQAYPTSERDLNGENYDAVIARQGEDGLDTHIWWDVD